jgi:hypothetical protein
MQEIIKGHEGPPTTMDPEDDFSDLPTPPELKPALPPRRPK